MLKMTFGALVAAGLFLTSAGALARPGSVDRYDRVGRPAIEQVRAERTQHVRSESRTRSRAPQAVDARRSRGELAGDAAGRSPVSRAEHGTKSQRAGQSVVTGRQSQVSNCSEFANCGGSSDGSSAKGSSSRSKSHSSAREAYQRKVWLHWAKKFEKMYMPPRATTADDFMP
jgi:hypothetical protein